ncbi:polysaccharide deacetylase family protein [Pedobacter sp. G11]|uniref:polysaccharide deacetylase family protein n=1 Tax=Pedobacter sp. G11 TaxID=2482728 RepID=UPI000F5F351C|nr:polysaccharide deacetylase family protein [Pedobacter sp. G11]AZI25825.1 polysaccharide deacetylase family protein [Pedobacter sp. G11]
MLHHVDDSPARASEGWTISVKKFDLLLDSIEYLGLETTTFEEIVREGWELKQLKEKVILTFDDCAANLFEYVVPTLLQRGMKAVFYIPVAQIGGYNKWDVTSGNMPKINLMDASQLRYLSKNGMEIGSHGHEHLHGFKITESQFVEELNTSKNILENLLSKPVISFCYPYGEVPKRYNKLLRTAGYHQGISIYQPFSNRYALRRTGIHASDTKKSISFKLSKRYALYRWLIDKLLKVFK